MRLSAFLIASMFCSLTWATPISYLFSGVTTNIVINTGDYDPSAPLVRDDSSVVTNGDIVMTGRIVFDPEQFRSGAGGTGLGEVISWDFTTQGLNYSGAGGAFHYLNFADNALSYLDEVPTGGYGPDVVGLNFEFAGTPFAIGPADFPVLDFLGGSFSTDIDLAVVNDQVTMYGLQGLITDLWLDPTPRDLDDRPVDVTAPSSVNLMLIGLLFLSAWSARKARRAK